MKVSKLAENIIGSEIIKLAADVNEKIRKGETIYNLTIGDFDPSIFPIPCDLKSYIQEEYQRNETNYPAADGMPALRNAVAGLLNAKLGLRYDPSEILVAGGARPLIYSIFRAIVDPGDKVIFATPSWNNNHYTYLNSGQACIIETTADNNFMPSAADLASHVGGAALLALCSPQNPTGTAFTRSGLESICDLVLEENKRRGAAGKPLYLMYDQIYWALTYGEIRHYDPVTLRPEMRDFTVYVDGISKSLAATGLRVGWSMGPKFLIDKMKSILTHVGAWAPRAEQLATARFLSDQKAYDSFLEKQRSHCYERLRAFYNGFVSLRERGMPVNAVPPQAAIYLTVQFELHGYAEPNGSVLETTQDVTRFILDKAQLAIVPFYAFGASPTSSWYRLSIGTARMEDIPVILQKLGTALGSLKK